MLKELVTLVRDRLGRYLLNDAIVLGYPEAPSGSGFAAGMPRITVAYIGSQFAAPRSMTALAQDRTCQVAVYLQAQDLLNDESVLPLIEKIQHILTGFEPFPNGGYMYPTSDDFVSDTNKNFLRELRFAVPQPHTVRKEYF